MAAYLLDGKWMATQKKIKIKPVNKTNWKDFEALFQSKGAPSYCWCMAWRMNREELKKNTSKERKALKNGAPWRLNP